MDAGNNFDLMQLLSEVQNEEIPDQDLLFAATQLEQNQASEYNVVTTSTSTSLTRSSVVKKQQNPAPTFTQLYIWINWNTKHSYS